jgi:hypothetical protein
MARLRAQLVTAVLAAGLLALPAAATAKSPYPDTPKGALRDCAAGHYPLEGHYTIAVLQKALKLQLADKLQYTNCATVLLDTIHKLELTERHSSGAGTSHPRATRGGHGVVHSSTANPIQNRLRSLKTGGGAPVLLPVTGQTVTPGTVTARGTSFLSSVPTPLLIVIAGLLATVLAVGARAVNNLVRTQRPH